MTDPIAEPTPTEPTGVARVRALAAPEAIGLLLGVVLIAALATTGALPVVGGPPASADPRSPTATPSASPSASGLAPATRSAVVAAIGVNGRLAEHGVGLAAEIDAEDESGAAIATILRSMNQDLGVGVRAADRIAGDPLTVGIGVDLRTFYTDVMRRADEALGLSIREGAAYRTAAAELLTVLAALPALDDRLADALEGRTTPSTEPPSSAPSPSPSASTSPEPSESPSESPTRSPDVPGSPSASPPGVDLIDNGSFERDLAGWSLHVEPGAAATASHDAGAGPDGSGAARIDILVGSGARAGIAFVSPSFPLERGHRYQVSAMLRSTESREIRLRVTTDAGQTAAARAFAIGPNWSRVTFELTELVAGSASVLALDLGRGETPVWLDDVVISPLG